MVATALVTGKGQVTVPKEVRDALGLKPGDRLDFVKTAKGQMVIRRRLSRRIADLFGSLPPGVVPATDEAIDEAIGEAVATRSAG